MDTAQDLKNGVERRRVRDRDRDKERESGLVVSGCSREHQRVKVYRLNEDGKWEDQGTGHVTVDYLERSDDLGLFVIDEEDSETLLSHKITPDDIYRKQEDTIISWRDPEYSTELALSFQENAGWTTFAMCRGIYILPHLIMIHSTVSTVSCESCLLLSYQLSLLF
ncbi:Serine/threonine-protein phosphatase 4 regulatory subunit 3 [Bienertia sinuspersici]